MMCECFCSKLCSIGASLAMNHFLPNFNRWGNAWRNGLLSIACISSQVSGLFPPSVCYCYTLGVSLFPHSVRWRTEVRNARFPPSLWLKVRDAQFELHFPGRVGNTHTCTVPAPTVGKRKPYSLHPNNKRRKLSCTIPPFMQKWIPSSHHPELAWCFSGGSTCQCRRLSFNPWVGKLPLEKEVAVHSRILAWRIPWTEESGGLQAMRLQKW